MKETDLQALLKDMSLEEKIMQLVQLPGWVFQGDAAVTGLADATGSERVKMLAGSTLGLWGADRIKAIQDAYMKNQPHHIPMLFMLDVIHGHKTVMPCPLGQGATFDPDTVKKGAEVQAKEASADGVHVTFSPMADLVRDARWGRVLESTGEDKYLNSRLVAAMVEGYQGEDPKDADHVAACVKHFAAYGGAEAGRDYTNVELSEHTLREQYLPGYRAGIDAGAKLVMTSFNTLNGIPSSANKWLMRDILRDDMKFDGVLISDWAAIAEIKNWGLSEDFKEASRLAMEAGVDIDMCTDCYQNSLEDLLKEGAIKEDLIDEAVIRVLRLKNDLGLFEDPYHGADADKLQKLALSPEHRDIARDAARKSFVLLKNDENALPLTAKKLAFIGPYVTDNNLHSTWAISCDENHAIGIETAVKELYDGSDVECRFAVGCEMLADGTELSRETYTSKLSDAEKEALLKEALEAARWADEVVLCLGEDICQSGESTSRVSITLPKPQLALFEKVVKAAKKTVTLIFNGRPLELDDISKKTDALLVCWRPGTEGAHAVADVISGKFSPQGKLPMSFPYTAAQAPVHYDSYSTGRPKPTEGPSMFTSRFLDCPNEPRYRFGYGLTYSKFEVSEVKLSADKLEKTASAGITAAVSVKNVGNAEATETVQLYIRDLVGSRVRPVKELKGFKKVTLAPGESKEVSFQITEDMLRFWTMNNCFESETGKFKVFVGLCSCTENAAEFELI
jgi:beta-glucosidase